MKKAALLAAASAIAWVWWRARPFRVEIEGDSMSPTLSAGDWAIATRTSPRPGDVVVLEHPKRPGFELVKRATGRSDSGEWFVEGDNPEESTDSRSFGPVPASAIRGCVRFVYAPRLRLV